MDNQQDTLYTRTTWSNEWVHGVIDGIAAADERDPKVSRWQTDGAGVSRLVVSIKRQAISHGRHGPGL